MLNSLRHVTSVALALSVLTGCGQTDRVARLELEIEELYDQLYALETLTEELDTRVGSLASAGAQLEHDVARLDYEDWRDVMSSVRESSDDLNHEISQIEEIVSEIVRELK